MKAKLIATGALLLFAVSAMATAEDTGTPSAATADPHVVPPKHLPGNPHRSSYPEVMIRQGVSGVTELSFVIRKDGTVGDIRIVRSSGWKPLDQSAVSAAADWRYEPATRDGQPIDYPSKAIINWQTMGNGAAPPDRSDFNALQCQNNTPSPAIDSCTKTIAATSGKVQADAYYHRGLAYDSAGQRDKAAADFTTALGIDGTHARALLARAIEAEAQGRFAEALPDLDKALVIDPKLASAWAERAYVHNELGQSDAAKADYAKLADLAPDCAPIHVDNCPRFYRRRIEKIDDVLDDKPNDIDALNARCAERALTNRQFDLALADCDRAIALAPNYAPARDSRAFVYVRLGRYGDAVKEYASVPAEGAGSTTLYLRGVAKLRAGDTTGGRADILAAKTMDANVASDMAFYGITP